MSNERVRLLPSPALWQLAAELAYADPAYCTGGYLGQPGGERGHLAERERSEEAGRVRNWAAVERVEGCLAGLVAVHALDEPGSIVRGEYWIVARCRGHGFATEALRLLIEWLDATSSIQRLDLTIERSNSASRRVAEKAGCSCRLPDVHDAGLPKGTYDIYSWKPE